MGVGTKTWTTMEVVHVFYEDRVRAVALLIRLGKRAKATILQLGYPSKNALKGWYLEYEHYLDLRLVFAPGAPKFTQAQKEAAVEHHRTHSRCISAKMRALGYPARATLPASVFEAFSEISKAATGKTGRPRYRDALKKAGVVGLYNR